MVHSISLFVWKETCIYVNTEKCGKNVHWVNIGGNGVGNRYLYLDL